MTSSDKVKEKLELSFKRAELSDFFRTIEASSNKFFWFIWTFKITKSTEISPSGLARNNLRRLVNHLGFRKVPELNTVVHRSGQTIRLSSIEEIKATVFETLRLLEPEEKIIHNEIEGIVKSEWLVEIFMLQQHMALNKTSLVDYLTELEDDILADTRECAYIPFRNGIVRTTKNGSSLINYQEINKLVWKEQIIPHDFEFMDYTNFMVQKFIFNVCAHDHKRVRSLRSILGYLLHNHFDISENRLVVLVDEEASQSDAPEGGSGKGLSAQILAQVRTMVTLDGKRLLSNNRFLFQEVRTEHQIVHLDDVKSNFDTVTLNSVLSDGLTIETKGSSPIKVPKERTPKFLISANAGLNTEGTTRRRRQIIFPFGNHYSQLIRSGITNPIIHEHGGRFFDNTWSESDWNAFFSLTIDCIQLYLKEGVIELENQQIKDINLKTSTRLEFVEFSREHIQLNTKTETKKLYECFLTKYEFDQTEIKQRTFSNWLKKYAQMNGYEYENRTESGIGYFNIKN